MPCTGFHNIRIDVTGKVGGGLTRQLQQTVTVHLPDPTELLDPPIVMFGLPGGGAGRGFWCLETNETTAWSQARYHADRGVVYVSVDHLGAGESTSDDVEDFTMEVTTAGNIATVREILLRLADGTLIDGFPAVSDPVTIAMGQSMGAYFLIQMQGQQAPFEAVAIMGYSCIHTVIPVRPDEDPLPPPGIPRNSSPATLGVWADRGQAQDQKSRDRRLFYMSFFNKHDGWIIEEKFLVPAFSATMPGGVKHALSRGVVAEEASRIECPVFLGFGERDVTQNPWAEPAGYFRSRDIRLAVIPGLAHGHNFETRRTEFWTRLHPWALWVASQAR
jgi:pimeloyl-ACP methyl ester carboxylesterase